MLSVPPKTFIRTNNYQLLVSHRRQSWLNVCYRSFTENLLLFIKFWLARAPRYNKRGSTLDVQYIASNHANKISSRSKIWNVSKQKALTLKWRGFNTIFCSPPSSQFLISIFCTSKSQQLFLCRLQSYHFAPLKLLRSGMFILISVFV